MTDAQKRAYTKYRKTKTVSVNVIFYKNTEQALIDKINNQKNKSGYIKKLIKKDIEEGSATNG